ncbi:MAG: hypothetical protein AAGA60_15435 [Cyanobacteria bacterium P01_E01_bin.42]
MTKRNVRITVLCEDLQQQVFVRYFLIGCGFHKRKLRFLPLPDGKGSGEQYVRNQYLEQVRAYRSKKAEDICLIVLIDADTQTVQDRLNQFDRVLEENSQNKRQDDERIAIFVPKRNIETWIHYLQGETVDEETAYKKLPQESECKLYVEELSDRCPSNLDENAPSSLHTACQEWQRILPPN